MAEKITHNGIQGVFMPEPEWDNVKKELQAMKSDHAKQIAELKKEVEIAQGESKYKLKKLASIIERRDKQIAALSK